jgi:hypothetical protein
VNPGISDQVVTRRYRQIVARSLCEQFAAGVLPTSAGAPAVRTVLQQQLDALLVRVRARLQDVHAGPGPWLAPDAVGTEGASASSPQPIYWLSPCRLP